MPGNLGLEGGFPVEGGEVEPEEGEDESHKDNPMAT